MVDVALPSIPPSAHTPAYGEVDLTTCDREPIHIPGAIQPHGVLLAVDRDLAGVVVASRNTLETLGMAVEDVIGSDPRTLLGDEIVDGIAGWRSETTDIAVFDAVLGCAGSGSLRGAEIHVRAHRSDARTVIEIEDVAGSTYGLQSDLNVRSSQEAMFRLAQAGSVVELGEQLAHEIRQMVGFDRVMVYRFDADWNGEVIAEERRADLNPFLGLHYPATDIPAQARRLYTVNWTRLIVDIGYTPVALEPLLDPATSAPLDLSHSSLRSVSPIHVEYLGHMGVTASMSISLIVNGELWGLVACHHYSGAHRPSQDARAGAGLLGQVASQMFSDRERAEFRDAALLTHTRLSELTARVTDRVTAREADPLDALFEDEALAGLLDAQGVAVFHNGEIRTSGKVPSIRQLRRISAALDLPGDMVASSDEIAALDVDLGEDESAGALRVRVGDDRWVMWLRQEMEQFVDWGGDPTNKLLAAQEGAHVRLSPRRSFEKWRQVVRGTSMPWTPWQHDAAESLGNSLTSLLLLQSRDQIAMAESMQRSVVLDRAPELPDMSVSARYLPASTLQLGGDWWDAFELPGRRTALVVGDVAGHGVHAASAMVQIRTGLRAYLIDGHSPADCLDKLDILMAQLFSDQVATAVVAVMDADSGTVELASAGHPPAVVIRGREAELIWDGHRPLLGLGWPSAHSVTVPLAPGDTVLLYTDGLVERRDLDLGDALEGLRVVCARVQGPPDLDSWTDTLLRTAEASPEDDTTLLAFRRR